MAGTGPDWKTLLLPHICSRKSGLRYTRQAFFFRQVTKTWSQHCISDYLGLRTNLFFLQTVLLTSVSIKGHYREKVQVMSFAGHQLYWALWIRWTQKQKVGTNPLLSALWVPPLAFSLDRIPLGHLARHLPGQGAHT